MGELKQLRWERLKEINIPYNYVKEIVKEFFGYEIKESSLNEFICNLNEYKQIDESILLFYLERYSYKKLNIYSIKKSSKQNEVPICDELRNPITKAYFNEKNRITLEDNKFFYNGDLDTCYQIVYYNECDKFIEIKLACVKKFFYENIDESLGITIDESREIYDCSKFIINLEKKLVFMFYNDSAEFGQPLVTAKKVSFYKFFSSANKSNLIKYDIGEKLVQYFKSYIDNIEDGNPKKLISIIGTKSILGKSNAIKSISDNYIHNQLRLNAINYAINNENHTIHTMECVLDGNFVKLKNSGEINLENNIFKEEVITNVCKEFFNSEKLYKLEQ